MTTRFVGDSQIATRLLPLFSMRRDPSPADSPLCEQMRQLMAECSIYLVSVNCQSGSDIAEQRIKRNEFLAIIRAASAGSHPRIPFHANLARKLVRADRAQEFARMMFERVIAVTDNL